MNDYNTNPKFITAAVACRGCIYWIIISGDQLMYILRINLNGEIVLTPINTIYNTAPISVHRESDHTFVTHYVNANNIITRRRFTYNLAYSQFFSGNCDMNVIWDDDTTSVPHIEHVGNLVYMTKNNKLYCINNGGELRELSDYPHYCAIVSNCCGDYVYSYNKCLNTVYRNNKLIYKFKKSRCMLRAYYLVTSQLIVFTSKDKLTYLIDGGELVTKQKFPIDNLKFVDDLEIPSLFHCKSKLRLQLMTFMLANNISANKIPKLLLYQIIYLLDK